MIKKLKEKINDAIEKKKEQKKKKKIWFRDDEILQPTRIF